MGGRIDIGNELLLAGLGDSFLAGDGTDDIDALLSAATMGDDDDDFEMGANISKAMKSAGAKKALRAAMARRMLANRNLVTEREPSKSRRISIGVNTPAAVGAGLVGIAQSQPQVAFRPTKLSVSAAIAPLFLILNAFVGKDNQFADPNPQAADAFIPNADDNNIAWDTAQVSQFITMQVQNIGGAPAFFRAVLVGDAVM